MDVMVSLSRQKTAAKKPDYSKKTPKVCNFFAKSESELAATLRNACQSLAAHNSKSPEAGKNTTTFSSPGYCAATTSVPRVLMHTFIAN
jgi:hypothetical protein